MLGERFSRTFQNCVCRANDSPFELTHSFGVYKYSTRKEREPSSYSKAGGNLMGGGRRDGGKRSSQGEKLENYFRNIGVFA